MLSSNTGSKAAVVISTAEICSQVSIATNKSLRVSASTKTDSSRSMLNRFSIRENNSARAKLSKPRSRSMVVSADNVASTLDLIFSSLPKPTTTAFRVLKRSSDAEPKEILSGGRAHGPCLILIISTCYSKIYQIGWNAALSMTFESLFSRCSQYASQVKTIVALIRLYRETIRISEITVVGKIWTTQ